MINKLLIFFRMCRSKCGIVCSVPPSRSTVDPMDGSVSLCQAILSRCNGVLHFCFVWFGVSRQWEYIERIPICHIYNTKCEIL